MLAEAYYHNGRIEFTQKLNFRHTRFKLHVEVPDDEIVNSDTSAATLSAQNEFDLLLAKNPDDPWLHKMKAAEESLLATPEDQLPELTEKQLERIAAFSLRKDR